MDDLSNTIAHILEHKQHLAEANEATIQQYVVLPILRALEWNDVNLTSMEIIPEYAVEDGRVDYALKVGQKLALFLECKKWNESLDRHENQIVTYAVKVGMPIVCLTNGKIWRFYFSWIEGTSVRDRIFCETDIEDREAAVSDLEKYLLKSNVASGEAELNSEIALKEKEKTSTTENGTSVPNSNPVNDVTDTPSEKRPITVLPESDVEWTIERVRNSLSQELRASYKKTCSSEEKCELFYGGVAGVQNLLKEKKWKLNQAKLSKMLCGFWLTDKGVIGNIKRIFGILPQGRFPIMEIVDRDGKLIPNSWTPIPPRLFVRITEEDAEQLEHKHHGCKFCGVAKDKSVDYVYYDIPENMSILLPVLEFAYKKHTGTNLSDNT